MDINGINPVNINAPVKPLKTGKNPAEAMQKQSDFCALDISNSYGRALIKKNNVSFRASNKIPNNKSQIVYGREFTSLSPFETEEYRADIQKRLKNMPDDFRSGLMIQNINKNNVFIYDRIISNQTVYNRKFNDPEKRKEFVSRACTAAAFAEQQEETKRKLSVLDKVLSEKRLTSNDNVMSALWPTVSGVKSAAGEAIALKIFSEDVLCNNEAFMKTVPQMVSYTSSVSESVAKSLVIDKVLSDDVFCKNENFTGSLSDILSSVKTDDEAAVKIKLLDKISSSEKLTRNKEFIKNSVKFVSSVNTDYTADVKIKLLDKILFDEKLYNNEDFMQSAIYMLEKVSEPSQAEQISLFLDKILSDDNLNRNDNIMKNAGYIAGEINSDEKLNLAEKIISDKNLYSNEVLMSNAGRLISVSDNPFRIKFAEKMLSNENLYGDENIISASKNIIGEILNEENYLAKNALTDKILSVSELYQNKSFMAAFFDIIASTKDLSSSDAKIKLIDSVFPNEKILNSECGLKTFAGILSSPDLSQAIDTAQTVMNDEKLYNNENIAKNAANIMKCSNNPLKAEAAKKIITSEYLRNDNELLGKLLKFYMYEDYSDEKIKAVIDLSDIISENPERYLKKGRNSLIHVLSYGIDGVNNFVGFMKKGAGLKEISDVLGNFQFVKRLGESLDNPSVMRKLLTSGEYKNKISKAIEGNYSEQLNEMLDPDNLGFETTEILSSSFESEDEFLIALEKLAKSTFKPAMKKPNQYLSNIDVKYTKKINGKYPKLSAEETARLQKKTEAFFSKNLGKMLRALKYIDTDTLNQMMDKRTNLFEKSLQEINELTDENYETLSSLIKCRNSVTGKELTAKDKIQLCQLVETYQKTGIDIQPLKEDARNGEVNLYAAKKTVEKRILNEAGLSDEEIATIPEERLKLNEEFSYLTLNLDDEELKELILTMIRESVRGNFESFIQDTSNKYGRANLETRKAFEKNGINYAKWMSPSIDDVDFTVANKQMKIKLWERNPQEDIFIGNKTTCCTAIGNGKNQESTPLYLLNTAYNVAELYDAKGNVIGMSRVFAGKLNGENSLFMDNIELNKTFTKGMSNDELKCIRDNFFKYMKNYAKEITGDENTPVYFCNSDAHVPLGDLLFTSGITEFTGEISEYMIYVNAAGTSRISLKNLPSINVGWRVVP